MGDSSSAVPGSKSEFHTSYHDDLSLILSRSSKMQHFFSLMMAFQTLPLSFLPWTASMRSLPPMHLTLSIPCLFKPHSQWGRRPLIVTTAKLSFQKFIGLLWVCTCCSTNIMHSVNCIPSSPPSTQAAVFPKCWLDRRMDRNVTEDSSRPI
jgi:hypothetical protein